ncbi:MAG: sigma 54-interacting transcriptional regulator [Planctomycetales bacterium]|nr:sigma 54-interacting transcriptional regulator [Planctomycetales bacterium]
MPFLKVTEPSGVRIVPLKTGPITLGRSSDNSLVLEDQKSSRRHCVVERAPGGGFRVRDLHSLNGTFVNGATITEHVLRHGDRIEIGQTEILFETGNPPEPAPPPPPPPPQAEAKPASARMGDANATRIEPAPPRPRGEETLESLRQDNENLRKLLAITQKLASELRLEKLLEIIVDTAIRLTDAERGFLVLVERGALSFQVARNYRQENLPRPDEEISTSITKKVLETGEPVLTADAQADERFRGLESVRDLRLRSVLCVGLRASGEALGVLYIDNHVERGLFAVEDVELLQAFAAQAAIALHNARLIRENEKKHEELAESHRKVEELNRELASKVERQTQELLAVKVVQEDLRVQLQTKYNYDQIIGRSPKMQEIFRLLDRITDVSVPVLVQGESGTGKELIARAIHYNGPRKDKPFVSENCAAISETLLESELFGYVRGAFTGADRNKKGLFEIANGGTLFLDEVGDMSPDMQKKLLRVLQEGTLRPVGGKDSIGVDVRVVSATNRKLEDLMREGRFREDLYYRLNVVTITVPPLRDRKEDIPLLIEKFLDTATEAGQVKKSLRPEVTAALMKYDWPGNIRELQNEILKMVALGSGDEVDVSVLSPHIRAGGPAMGVPGSVPRVPLKELVESLERDAIRKVLAETRGNKSAAAKQLGLSRLGLRKKMERYGIGEPG